MPGTRAKTLFGAAAIVLAAAACGAKSTGGPDALSVHPPSATVSPAGTVTFSASRGGLPVPGVQWSLRQGAAGGTITPAGLYTAPAVSGAYDVLATDPGSGASAEARVTVSDSCWRLLAVDRVRVVPRAGQASAMRGGTIQGSHESATNGFAVLASVADPPADAPAFTEVSFANGTPYRWVKYVGPAGAYGQIAELELWAGTARLSGAGFGTAGSRSGNPWPNALDGDPGTFFDGPFPDDVYVGIDVASDHVVATPVFVPPAGAYPSGRTVAITSTTPGALIRYTTDGSDPAVGGITYSGPFLLGPGTTSVRAFATADCRLPASATAVFEIGSSSPTTQSSLHVGNSLTDTIDGWLVPVAASGGYTLDFWRYTIPGIGTYIYEDEPSGGSGLEGSGVGDVQSFVRSRPFDHLAFQPAANMPCVPTGHASESPASNRSDAVNIARAWDDAVTRNPGVQLWVYETWPAPTAFVNCLTGGWNRDPAIWNPPVPGSWEEASLHTLQYAEAVRAGLVALRPSRPPPYVIPGGLALANLKARVLAGGVPGVAADPASFYALVFQAGASEDDHLSPAGRWFVTLVFHACMFQASPMGLSRAGTSLTAEQAAVLQQVVWDTVLAYPLSGAGR